MNLFSIFKNSSTTYPSNIALVVKNVSYTYRDLDKIIGKISSILLQYDTKQVGVMAYRSLTAYSGILAILQLGKTYVPLNPKFPVSRNEKMVNLSHSKVLIVDNGCIEILCSLNKHFTDKLTLIFPETQSSDIPSDLKGTHDIYAKDDLKNYSDITNKVDENDFAYIMFTSGSTGIPKGVPVSHANVFAYVDYLHERYKILPTDRFSQTFDITFDLSVHDMFLAWRGGATLYCIPDNVLMAPAKFIKENKLTMWFSVPSLAQFMNRFKMLKPESFPDLRYSLFCGEPLPKSIAISWQKAANNSIVENIYGPTETTIGITHYRVPKNEQEIKEKNGVVAIGEIFQNQQYCLIDNDNNIVEEEGELCLSGSQVTTGYWENEQKTAEQFIRFNDSDKLWYKTGDIVNVKDNVIYYLSRKDFQVKVRGYRIELDEINLAISTYTGESLVFTIPYPVNEGIADSLYSFISDQCNKDKVDIIQYLSSVIPEYMIPIDIIFVKDFPLNVNGKIDRAELIKLIKNY